MFSRNLTLAGFDGIIAELDHFAAVKADEVIVMMLLSQFEDGFTTFKIMAGHDTGIIKLVQHAIHGRQTNFFTHIDKTLIKVFRTAMVIVWPLKHFKDF